MTPLRTEQWSATWAAENAGAVGDIQALADPGADNVLMWDDSASAVIWTTEIADSFLSANVPLLNVNNEFAGNLTIENATPSFILSENDAAADNGKWDFIATSESFRGRALNDAISAAGNWLIVNRTTTTIDSIALTATSITANGSGVLTAGDIGSTIQAWDTQLDDIAALAVTDGNFIVGDGTNWVAESGATARASMGAADSDLSEVDFSGITEVDVSDLAATDNFLVDDGGTTKRIEVQGLGVKVVSNDADQTFALGDANTLQTIGATSRTWTIPANASVAFHVGAIIYCASTGAGTITIDPASGVTINSFIAQASTTNRSVVPGGTAALIKVGTDAWNLTGDIA